MFFHRKPANRRLGREYVLDVKLRSSQVRAVRMRRTTIAISVMLGAAFGAFMIWRAGHWALDELLYENAAFATRQIDMETDGVISTEQLKTWAGVKRSDNLLALDLARVKHNLESVPFIQTVSVERVLPHTLRIRVAEREPIAQIEVQRTRSGGGFETLIFNIDPDGAIMPPLDPKWRVQAASQPADQGPLIIGAKVVDARPGQLLQAPQVKSAIDLILAFDRSPMAASLDFRRIDASCPGVLTATVSDGSEITFGCGDFEQQLRRWFEIQQQGRIISKALWTVDLAVSNNIPVKWLEASLVPVPTPKTPKPLRPKKKHV
jgi:cell division septal protein FtsQ